MRGKTKDKSLKTKVKSEDRRFSRLSRPAAGIYATTRPNDRKTVSESRSDGIFEEQYKIRTLSRGAVTSEITPLSGNRNILVQAVLYPASHVCDLAISTCHY